jgi:hypothetical protein
MLAVGLVHDDERKARARDDVLRAAWLLTVGAMDAYFCDTYADLVACTLITAQRQGEEGKPLALPEAVRQITVPVVALFDSYPKRGNWRWRMTAREMMARANFLSIFNRVDSTLNLFLPSQQRLLKAPMLDPWLKRSDATARLLGVAPAAYASMSPSQQSNARKRARERLGQRIGAIVQRRHDCAHECDRPKVSPQPIDDGQVALALADVAFFVERCHEHVDIFYPLFLHQCGASKANVRKVQYPTRHLP